MATTAARETTFHLLFVFFREFLRLRRRLLRPRFDFVMQMSKPMKSGRRQGTKS